MVGGESRSPEKPAPPWPPQGGIVASEEKTVRIESMNSSFSNVSFAFEGLDIEPVYTITINCYALLGEQREQMEMRTMFSV